MEILYKWQNLRCLHTFYAGMFSNMFLLFCLGKLLDQKSPYFQDEFPELAVGPEEKAQQSKKEEESKESQYGPGPSLRPQSN